PSQFIIALEDEPWQKFGQSDIARLREELEEAGRAAGQSIEDAGVRRVLRELQRKVEEENLAARRDVLKYDLVVHAQRETIYAWRRTLVSGEGYDPEELVRDLVHELCPQHAEPEALRAAMRAPLHAA